MRPRGFIGCSAESLEIARQIQAELDHDAEIEIWNQGGLKPSESTLVSLLTILDRSEFAVFVLSADDIVKIRMREVPVTRDNVIFELGLSFGSLGRNRTFMVVPRDQNDLHLPTDLLGIAPLDFDGSKENKRAAVGPACTSIRSAIRTLRLTHSPTTYYVVSSPTDLTQYGVTEVVGEIRLVKISIPPNVLQRTIRTIVTIAYEGVQITNSFPGAKYLDPSNGIISDELGITIEFSQEYLNAQVSSRISASVSNTALGGKIALEVPADILLRADGATITVRGVRVDCSGRSVGSEVRASIRSQPSHAMTFLNGNSAVVGYVDSSLIVGVKSAVRFIGENGENPVIRLIEGFSGAFVQYKARTFNARSSTGANGNTQIRILLSHLPAGVGLKWPDLVEATFGMGSLTAVSKSAETVVYEFRTPDQGQSDTGIEVFVVEPELLIDQTAVPGTVSIQAQLHPPAGEDGMIPRFNHPLINSPGDTLFQVCLRA